MCPLPPGSTRPYTLVPFTTLFRSLHQRVAEGVEADGFVGDLAQRDDGILVVVPIDGQRRTRRDVPGPLRGHHDQLEAVRDLEDAIRSEEHTSELQSLMRISYAVFCLTKKTK